MPGSSLMVPMRYSVTAADAVIDRLERAKNPGAEGKALCVELIRAMREIPGVAGVHVMAYRREELVQEIVQEAGIRSPGDRDDLPAAYGPAV